MPGVLIFRIGLFSKGITTEFVKVYWSVEYSFSVDDLLKNVQDIVVLIKINKMKFFDLNI